MGTAPVIGPPSFFFLLFSGTIQTTHPNNSIVLKLRTDKRHIFNFYRITRTYEDADNAECVEARPLQKHKKNHTHFYHKGKTRTPITSAGEPGYYDDKTKPTITDFADAFIPIKHTWIKLTHSNADKSKSLLITTNQHITFNTPNPTAAAATSEENPHPIAQQTITGSVTEAEMKTQYTNYASQFYRDETDGLVYKLDKYDTRYHCFSCSLAGHRGKDMQKCSNPQCYHHIHNRCHANTPWNCPTHAPPPPPPHTIPKLTPEELRTLQNMTTEMYSASDGSVLRAGTGYASSTFGIAIKTPVNYITRRGKFKIRQGEEASYRAEIEGIIWAYKIIPTNLNFTHAVDNTAAIDTHNWLLTKKECPTHDECRRKNQYITAIQRLWDVMQNRDALNIVHTKSHKEKETTDDEDLSERRQALAQADAAAGAAHNDTELKSLNKSSYTLYHKGEELEKKPLTSLKNIAKQNHYDELKKYPREGQSLSFEYPPWDTGSKQWPNHLQRLRHLLLIQRLPTAETRWKRHDKVKPAVAHSNNCHDEEDEAAKEEEKTTAATNASSSNNKAPPPPPHHHPLQQEDNNNGDPSRISPLCPICKTEINEDHIQDIPHHLSTCYLAKTHLPSLIRRLSTELGSKAPIYSLADNEAASAKFQETKKLFPQIPGTLHPKSPHLVQIKSKTMRTQWYNKVLHEGDLTTKTPSIHQTLAPPLLETLHTQLKITIHIGGIRANPHSNIPTKEFSELEEVLKSPAPQTILIQNTNEPVHK